MNEGVQAEIGREDSEPDKYLNVTGQALRVQDREQIPRDEVAAVVIEPRLCAERVLERCQWTDAAGKLDVGRPGDGRQVQPRRTAPFLAEQCAGRNEKHKDQMDEDDESRADRVDPLHVTMLADTGSPLSCMRSNPGGATNTTRE